MFVYIYYHEGKKDVNKRGGRVVIWFAMDSDLAIIMQYPTSSVFWTIIASSRCILI